MGWQGMDCRDCGIGNPAQCVCTPEAVARADREAERAEEREHYERQWLEAMETCPEAMG